MQHRIVSADEQPPLPQVSDGWRSSVLDGDLGDCRTERFVGAQGMSVAYTRYATSCDLVEESNRSASGRALTITVAMDGESGFRAASGQTLRFRGGFTTVAASCASVGERRFAQGKPVSQLRVSIDAQELMRYLGTVRAEALLGHAALQQIAFHDTASVCLTHARALARQALSHEQNTLAVYLHMLGVLHEETCRLLPTPAPRGQRARPSRAADLDKAEKAHQIMQRTFAEPLSLDSIATMVGTRAALLRRAFQARYDCSPQQAMLAMRMEHAHALLEEGVHVATAAYRVGYAHPSNFSAAFARYYGRTPKSVSKAAG